jgi:Ion channel
VQHFTNKHVAHLMVRSRKASSVAERETILNELVELYETRLDKDAQDARELRQAFLLTLEDHPTGAPIGFVFPLLFINADGLYWSLITAGSIGYGDITPVTHIGTIIAATLGIMGVITIGVIAGLILNWITPRRLDWH